MKKLFAAGLAAVVLAPLGLSVNLVNVYWAGTGDPGSYLSGSYTVNGKSGITAGLLGVYWKGSDTILPEPVTPAEKLTWNQFWGYCTSPDFYLGEPDNPWLADLKLDTGVTKQVAWLSSLMFDGVDYIKTTTSKPDHALVQLGIWQTMGATLSANPLTDSDTDGNVEITLSSGTFEFDPTASYKYGFFDALNEQQGQDIIGGGTPGQGVPEPFTLAFAGLGLAAALRRRAKR